MRCKECKRQVRNSFSDKLIHVLKYHPDRALNLLEQWPTIGNAIGQHIGEQTKRLVTNYVSHKSK